ncbi:MAG: M23 family metallopeptidase [Anaerolineales bacterium]|nr:M23 family metallopeptidase [Anaerolineales bacterium]
MGQPTFYDGRLSLVYWTPRSINETSIDQFAQNLRAGSPNINGVMVKTNNGSVWQGAFDSSKPNLNINSTADVKRWVDTLAARGLETHAWGVLRGLSPQAEVNRFVEICQVAGVKSLLLDLEEGPAYFVGTQSAALTIAQGLRNGLGPNFHIGLIFDYRGNRPQKLWVQTVWFPYIDSLHPMVYHYHFGQSAQTALQNCYNAIGSWGRPVYPMLQGYSPGGSIGIYPASDIPITANIAINSFGARGLSWYRYGRGLSIPDEGLGAADLPELAKVSVPVNPPPPPPNPTPTPPPPGGPIIIGPAPIPPDAPPQLTVIDPDNERTGNFFINYYDDPATLSPFWQVALDVNGRPYAFRPAAYNLQTLYVTYTPRLIGRGKYYIEVFVPSQNAYIEDAHYIVVDYPGGVRRETTCILNQAIYSNQWVPLQGNIVNGVPGDPLITQFDLTPTIGDAGRVNVADITFINPASHPSGKFEVAFGAIRWRPVNVAGVMPTLHTLDAPVGTEADRRGPIPTGRFTAGGFRFWLGNWFDVNPIGSRYRLGSGWAVHTGADLNLDGSVTADKDAPVYAMGDGVVIWARKLTASWGQTIVLEHAVPGEDGLFWARYAHLNNLQVSEGQVVKRGQQICTIGEYAPNNYHLHFDVTLEPILRHTPGHWPGDNRAEVLRVYQDPLEFIKRYHVVR